MKISWWLLPFSWLYGAVVRLRNCMFDCGLIKSRSYGVPLICVGNLTVGGTGKTPHTEYLANLLHREWRVAIVSRGYKRKSTGMVVADFNSTAEDIGDEPWQMKQKFRDVQLVVSRDRRESLDALLMRPVTQRPQVVILDDAFQHRRVKAGLNILLTDYNRLISDDLLLPAGRLREPFSGRSRAQIVAVTKCPNILSMEEQALIKKKLCLRTGQHLFFTHQKYSALVQVFGRGTLPFDKLREVGSVLLVCGIATPHLLARDLQTLGIHVETMAFHDHHAFSSTDVQRINDRFESMAARQDTIAVTTEKDVARLRLCKGLSQEFKDRLYALPLEVEFLNDQGEQFNKLITDYVGANQTNG